MADVELLKQGVDRVEVGGLTGATAASRYAGATASGEPASGTFVTGDYVIDQSGAVHVCTAGGTPGTWTTVGATTFVGVLVYKSADQSISNNTFTALTFDTEEYDTDGFHDNATNNTRLTVPSGQAGYYSVWAGGAWNRASTTGDRQLRLYKNASAPYGNTGTLSRFSSEGSTHMIQCTFPAVNLSVGDYVEVVGYQNSGGSLNIEGSDLFETAFGMVKIA